MASSARRRRMSGPECPKCGRKPLPLVTDGPTFKPCKPNQKFWRQCVCGYDSRKDKPGVGWVELGE